MSEEKFKKIAIVGCAGVPGRYGGFETLAENLAKFAEPGQDLLIIGSRKFSTERQRFGEANVLTLPFSPNGLSSVFFDGISMLIAMICGYNVILLGVSGAIWLPILKSAFRSSTVIVNIDGLEWRRAKWNIAQRYFLKVFERIAVHWADKVITDNQALKDYADKKYKLSSIFIPYGGDHVELPSINWESRAAYALCRIEPENNCDQILSAFSRSPDWQLIFIGNWDSSNYGKTLRKTFQKYSNLKLLDPIYDQHKLVEVLSQACLYIHGHSAGGTNPSLVEAVCRGFPVIAHDNAFNHCTLYDSQLYFESAIDLEQKLLMIDSFLLESLSEKQTKIQSFYGWSRIAELYSNQIE